MTPAEVQAMSQDRLHAMLASSGLIGVFGDGLIGFAAFGQRPLQRIKHRATVGPFFVDRHTMEQARLMC
ncbi:MAG: hypothetical protein AAF386_02265 [Pseudomonadota bacterium]